MVKFSHGLVLKCWSVNLIDNDNYTYAYVKSYNKRQAILELQIRISFYESISKYSY